MKKVGLMFVVLMATMVSVSAQKRSRNGGDPQQRIEKQVKQLDKELNLTDEQEKQVKVIYEDFFKLQAGSRGNSQTQREELNKKIESVLMPEQKVAYQKMKKGMPGNRRRNK